MASKPKRPYTIVRGGKLLDIAKRKTAPADILIKGDTIAEIGRPGLAAPAGATLIDAKNRLMHPGLINAHTHGPGNLGKGMGDLWSLELLLTASPWINGGRTLEDKYLSSLIGACEMVMKGCTAAYDLAAEFPLPSVDGLSAMAKAYEEVGMRAVLAPMVADITFFDAIPGLMERLSPALQKEVESFRYAPWKATTKQMKKALQKWPFEKVMLAVAPTIPASLQRRLPDRLPRPRARVRCRHPQPCGRVQGPGRGRLPALRHLARRPHGRARPGQRSLHGGARCVARRRGHEAAGRPRRVGGAQSRLQHAAGQRAGRHARHAGAAGQCRHRHRRRQLLGQSEHVRGDAARLVQLQGPGSGCRALDHHRGGVARGHRGQRPRTRPGKADRQDRAGLQGRHRLPRPAPHQLDPDQRSGERAGPHRGRYRPYTRSWSAAA